MHKKIFPSLIGSDPLNLENTVRQLEKHCDGFHNDIMDNHFVPNLTWGPLISNALTTVSEKPLWTHLMVTDPEALIKNLTIRPHDIISFHIESTKNYKNVISAIQNKGGIASAAIKPSTPLEALFPFLPLVNHVLLMSVEPGFSGQSFIESSISRLKSLSEHRITNNLHYIIGMDGGINLTNIDQLINNGCNDFAIASAIFDTNNPVTAIDELRAHF